MQRARVGFSHGHRFRILTFAGALIAASVPLIPWSAPAEAATLDRVKETGKLTLGYRTDTPPFSSQGDSDRAEGYVVEVCEAVADQLKADLALATLAVEWVPVTSEDQFSALQQGKIDLLCGAAVTLTTLKDADFSVPVFPGGIGALVNAAAPLGLREVLLGRPPAGPLWRGNPAQVLEKQTFSVVSGSPAEKWLAGKTNQLQLTATVVPVKTYDEGIQRILDGSSDVFFAERSVLLDAATRNPDARNLLVLDRQFTYGPLALGVQRGDADLLVAVDRALAKIYGSQQFRELYLKWFGEPDESVDAFFKMSILPE